MSNLGRWLGLVVMSGLGFCPSVWAQGQEIIFSATGDIPYSPTEVAKFQQQIANHNKYSPSAFFVHVGDIVSGGALCNDSLYSTTANMLRSLAVPVYVIPGDNETIDCLDPTSALNLWKQHFINFEQNFCLPPSGITEHQSLRPENWTFVRDGVLFIGINMVGGNSPYQDDADWVSQQLQTNVSQVRAAVVFSHVGPEKSTLFSTPFRQAAVAFAKPVLFLHGHGHLWSMNYPFPEPNILRVQVDNGAAEDPVEVMVTMDTSTPATAFILKRNPWTSQTIVNMPPCVDAGLDQIITFPQSATLNASASDDGNPNPPGALAITWSKVSGPGAVTFGDANALMTTASFGSIGDYVLRVTVNDSQLQNSDEVAVEVSSGIPIINSFSPASGAIGTEVTITGSYFLGATSVTFNGTPATTFTVNNATHITATVPAGANTGKIGVVNANGTGFSATDFIVRYSLTVNTFGFGSVALDPPNGVYDAGTDVTLTATPASGYQFSSWGGDLSGSNNPAAVTMNADKNVTAIFISNAASGQITHEETCTGGSSSLTQVATSTSLTAMSGHLYLAAISTRPKVSVLSVSGLGLNWTLVKAQCSGRNNTGVEVWKAFGTPSQNETVMATLASAPNNAVIAASRYSGVEGVTPIGNGVSGNANGVNGACAGGVDTSFYSFNFIPQNGNGAMVYAAIAMRAKTHTPGAGYTERAEIKQGSINNTMASVAVEDQRFASASTITVNGTFNGGVDYAVVALEIKPQLSLTVNTTGSGSVTLNPPGGIYNTGTVVTLTATPAAGFQFNGWSGDLSGSTNPATLTMNSNKTVTAIFTPLLTLTTNTVGSGTVALNPPGGIYEANTVVTLTATPAMGFEFTGWSGDLSGAANPATMTMSDDKTVTATFTPLPPPQYTLTVNKIGSGSVTLNPTGGIYDENTVVILTAAPVSGFEFSGWSGDLSGASNPATITMNANKTITATFSPLPLPIVHKETRVGGASNSTTVTTLANLTGVDGHLYLAAISMRPKVSVLSVTGLGLNWTLVKSKCAGRNTTAIEVWKAQGIPQSETVTATFASAPSTAVIAVSRYSGVTTSNPIGNVLAGNTNGPNASGACSGGVDNNTYSFNLTTTMNGAVVYGATALKAKIHTPGAGYAERAEVRQSGGTNTSGVAVEDKTVASAATIAVNGSFGGAVDWAMVALEIKPQVVTQFTLTINTTGSGSVTLNPPGGVYNQGTVVTLIPQSGTGFAFSGWSGDLSGASNPATITLSSNKTVTATFAPSGSIVHEETQTGGASNSTIVKTSTVVTGASEQLYLAAISTRPKVSVSSINGLGLNWALVRAKCAGRNTTGLEVWMAQGEPSSDDTIKATLASAPTTAVITVSRYSGVAIAAPIGNIVAANTTGLNANAACAGGVDNSAYSFNLTTTMNGALAYAAVALKARTHTPGAGYTELVEAQQPGGNLNTTVAVEDRHIATASTATVNGSFNGAVDWVVVALEIKPEVPLSKRGDNLENGQPATAPSIYQLYQNYPNPFGRSLFNAQSVIEYSLPQETPVRLVIYNLTGQIVRRLVDGTQAAGRHRAIWNGKNEFGEKVASGIYLYQLQIGAQKLTRKMILQQ